MVTGRSGESYVEGRHKHVLIRVPFGINRCSGDHPEEAGLLQCEGRV
jgi:hypothetical protein